MNKETYQKIRPAVYAVFEKMPMNTIFSAAELKDLVVEICPAASKSYIASVIRPLWDYRQMTDKKAAFICVDKNNGLYKKITIEEWSEVETKIKKEKLSKSIAKAVTLLRQNGFEVKKA